MREAVKGNGEIERAGRGKRRDGKGKEKRGKGR